MRRLLKWVGIIVSIPVILSVFTSILLYIPPVQNYIVGKTAKIASESTGMNISLRRISLSFPLDLVVHDALVVQEPDTLLNVNRLSVSVQLWPLVKQKVEINGIKLEDATVNTLNMIEGMTLVGNIGELQFASHNVNLEQEEAFINDFTLKDTHATLCLTDTTAADTTESAPVNWKIKLDNVCLENIALTLTMPLDSISTSLSLDQAQLKNGIADLSKMAYQADKFMLKNAKAGFKMGDSPLVEDIFNPSHVMAENINIDIDSIYYEGNIIQAGIKEFCLQERSGLAITSTRGKLEANDERITVPRLKFNTNHSSIEMEAAADWTVTNLKDGAIRIRLNADLSKNDMFRFIPELNEQLKKSLPEVPLEVRLGIDGNISDIRLTAMSLQMPGIFDMGITGRIQRPLETFGRNGEFTLNSSFSDMNFLKALTGGITIPRGTELDGTFSIQDNDLETSVRLTENKGTANIAGTYNLTDEKYSAKVNMNNLDLNDFMPNDSLYSLTTAMEVSGQGFDIFSPTTLLNAKASLSHLQYGKRIFSGISLEASHANHNSVVGLKVKDNAMDISTKLTATLKEDDVKAKLDLGIKRLDFYDMGLVDFPMSMRMNVNLDAKSDLNETHKMKMKATGIHFGSTNKSFGTKDIQAGAFLTGDSVKSYINSGDLTFFFGTEKSIDNFTNSLNRIGTLLTQQFKQRNIKLDEVKNLLPTAQFRIYAKKDNPLANFLDANGVSFNKLDVKILSSKTEGLNSSAQLHNLRFGDTRLDTIYFSTQQHEDRMTYRSGIIANKTRIQDAFDIGIHGALAADSVNMIIEYLNDKKEKGVYLGLEGALQAKGISLRVGPFDPIIAYRKFNANKGNYIYLSDAGRIHADLRLIDMTQTAFEFFSVPDSTVQQDLSLGLKGLDIGEIRRIVPYMPDISGIINAEAHYIQSNDKPNVSADLTLSNIAYNKNPLGNWSLSAVYLPTENGEHYADGYITHNGNDIITLNGSYKGAEAIGLSDRIMAELNINQFPVDIANAFVPNNMVKLKGNIDGDIQLEGSTSAPVLNGAVNMNSIQAFIPQISQTLKFEDKALTMKDNNLHFDNINIYTGSKRPFTIDGSVDVMKMYMDIRMFANNFELINTKRTRQTMAYGKLFVDLDSYIKGSLDELKMRGDLRILGSSDFTYILQESPLTVEDRLSETVTFISFQDTTEISRRSLPTLTLGGMDMLMNLHIDEGVQCMIDLNDAGNNYMKFEGGGNLTFQYTPEGNMVLNGRYTLMSGEMKYAISLISKTFNIHPGSFIEWTGNVMNPNMNIKATQRVRSSVVQDENNTRNVNFDVGVAITNRLEDMGFTFTIEAPDDGTMQNELASKSDSEKNKMAVTMLVTGMYMPDTGSKGGSFSTNAALNSLLQNEINKLAGNALKTVDINFGMDSGNNGDNGDSYTNYNFQLAKRFWNNRIRVVIGGKISTGNNAAQQDQSFIDNISIEYRLDNSGTRYVKLFHEKNFESVLDGEIMETGAGIVLRKRVSRLGELFIFRKKDKNKDKKKEKKEQKELTGQTDQTTVATTAI